MFKKDNFKLGLILGLIAPLLGFLLFKFYKFEIFSFSEFFEFILNEPGFRTLSAGLSVSLLLNAALFTIYINKRLDKTAKGIFITTLVYGVIILLIKTFY
ncbi:MAG: hypothetical protein JSR00_06675 [Bacteroidetes bacterium]|nr:hypothetical protein [Bacteroidota bacterium]